MNTELIAAVASLILTVLSGALAAFAKRGIGEISQEFARMLHPHEQEDLPPEGGLDRRLREVREAIAQQQRMTTIYRWADTFLTFGQFIVGGILATSFVQESLSKELIGGLGLLVLLSSLMRQNYRPDVQLTGARHRVARLKSLLRHAEDEISFLHDGVTGARAPHEIQSMLTNGLEEIDNHELADATKGVASKQVKRKREPAE